MWQDFLAALALMLVIEGVIPFMSPAAMRKALAGMLQMNDKSLRSAGLVSMLLGVVLLYLVR